MRLEWDAVGKRYFETGVDRGVLFPSSKDWYGAGVAWDGLTAVNENPSGAESSPQYADNIKYLNLISAEDYAATIEAFQSPKEFDECDGCAEIAPGVIAGQQARKPFAFSYRTLNGNDTEGQNYGYTVHLVYGCQAAPSERSHSTVNESPEAVTLSWEVTTTPVNIPDFKPTAHIQIRSMDVSAEKLAALEDLIYGSESSESRMPKPEELITMFKDAEAEG